MADYRQVVEKFQRAMSVQHDARAAVQVYAEDVTAIDFTMPAASMKGLQAKEAYLATFLRAFPDFSVETRNLFGSGDWFSAEITTRGTHTGPLQLGPGNTIPPTGRRIELPVCWVGRVNADGLCAEERIYYNAASLMEQLGLAGQGSAV